MDRRSLVALLATLAVALLLVSPAAADGGDGLIKGSLINTTSGGGVADQEVTLAAYRERTEQGRWTTRSDGEGSFSFQGLDASPDLTYQLSVEHQGAPYFSELVTFEAGATEREVRLEVSDTTTDETVVGSPVRHYLIQPGSTGLDVAEVVVLSNLSDRTYIGSREVSPGNRETLSFPLPPEALDLQLGTGFLLSRVSPVEGGISDSWPVYPGESQRILRYRIPSSGDSAAFTAKITIPTDRVNLLVPDVGVEVSVSGLPERSNHQVQGESYLMLSGRNLAAGTELQFKLDGLSRARPASPAPARGRGGLSPLLASGVAVALMAVVAGVALLVRRGRPRREEELLDDRENRLEPEVEIDDLEDERRELIAAIARLDDAFEAGRIGSEEYGRLRAQRKRRLVAVVARLRSLVATRSRSQP